MFGQSGSRRLAWVLGAAALAAAGAAWICRAELTAQREAFDTSARIAHRLLSQRAVEHEAILGTLALLQPEADDGGAAVQRLIALYPQLLRVHRRAGDGRWPLSAWDAAEAQSRAAGQRAVLASFDAQGGRFVILRAADPASFALEVDLQRAVPWADWPYDEAARSGPVRAVLGPDGGPAWRLHGDDAASAGPWPMAFSKHLAADSQPFDLRVAQSVGWSALPWGRMAAWAAVVAALAALATAVQRQRAERQRAEQLRRLDQVTRLGTLGEIGAGLAHELNQPLAALMASTQAAQRLLGDDTPDLATAREAVAHATAQARRAADVVQRLRRTIEPGATADAGAALQPVRLDDALRHALDLLRPELKRLGVSVQTVPGTLPALAVRADPVGVDQVLHNLLANALQAMERGGGTDRTLTLALSRLDAQAQLVVRDNGPGFAADALPHLFEPFFTTREGGLGLGLSLALSLAERFGGTLTARPAAPRGAEFTLVLPLA